MEYQILWASEIQQLAALVNSACHAGYRPLGGPVATMAGETVVLAQAMLKEIQSDMPISFTGSASRTSPEISFKDSKE